MAIYRNVSLSFWEDVKIVDSFTPEDKYFYLYLLTNPHTNLLGCYQISFKQMINETGYNKDTIEKLLTRMKKELKVIDFDFETNEVFIKKWYKYNWTKSEKLLKKVETLMINVKNEFFKKNLTEIIENYRKMGENTQKPDRVSIGYTYPMDTSVSVYIYLFINIIILNISNKNNIYSIFEEYLKLRIINNYTLSESVVKRLINKLNEYGKTDEEKLEIIGQAINGKWKDFYPLNEKQKAGEDNDRAKRIAKFLKDN